MGILEEYRKKNWKTLPPGCIGDRPASSLEYKTGTWKAFRPIRNKDKNICQNPEACLICWTFCPDSAIKRIEPNDLEFDMDYCKGCGICAQECPLKAIIMVKE
jgi:pyruvate ferredoxin oxidoreductase delta subunit